MGVGITTKAEFDNLISLLTTRFLTLNAQLANSIRLGFDIPCCLRAEENEVFLLLEVASDYQMNDDGSTTDKINYIKDCNFDSLVYNIRRIIKK